MLQSGTEYDLFFLDYLPQLSNSGDIIESSIYTLTFI
jgi:hypothetical protein